MSHYPACKIAGLIAAFIITCFLVTPSLAVTYSPGVTVGQYVKFGNYWGVGDPTFIENVVAMDWLRYEVTAVNGNNITLTSSGRLKNGNPVGGGNATYNVEAGTMSTQYVNDSTYANGPIIAGNLTEGDPIPPPDYLKVNKTKTATYLGLNRTVNIVNSTWTDPNNIINYDLVYDKITGLMLEIQYESNQTDPPRYVKYGSSVIETNISGSIVPEFTAALAATALLTLLTIQLHKRKHTQKPTEKQANTQHV